MDTNNDGQLNKSEIRRGYIEHLANITSDGSYVDELFNEADVNRTGTLDYHEFCSFAID